MPGISFGRDDYVTLVRDWMEKGADSSYVKDPLAQQHLRVPTQDEGLAEANFKLGVYFQQRGQRAKATQYMDEAGRLNPASWNYHRQNWIFEGEDQARSNWQQRVAARAGYHYYQPIAGVDDSA